MFEAELPYPPSVNRYWRHVGKMVLISREGRDFRERVNAIVSSLGAKMQNGELAISIDAYPPDRRRRDADNILKALLDSMTSSGIVSDDFQFKKITIVRREPMEGGMVFVRIGKYQEA